ncbi:MAG TPA: peptidoglycan DD-metalloendopeptidase family protein [Candidatus Aphodousia faecigallinarum]|uniref:Peptidoglycan DD-metalloendopeptidase family protein n=1 Tax=Candidatus Aphodousia faecigallinarum TaxID=2840677 RepID=A0A9D1IJV1_9BURK|nr:peptidoglycan DD-metalloendopeptidase family protein [Candidatus Aphodousia faecigallinarum]
MFSHGESGVACAQTTQKKSNTVKKNTRSTSAKRTTTSRNTKSTAKRNTAKTTSSDVSEKRRNELQNQQKSLQEQLGSLKKQLSQAEASQSEASDALAASEEAISKANRKLRELGNERTRVENRLKELREQELSVSGQLTSAEKQNRAIARAQFLNSRRQSWQTLIAGTNPHEVARDAASLQYFARAQQKEVNQLSKQQADIHSVSQETQSKRKELANIEANEKKGREQLMREQQTRKQTLEKLKKQISEQRASIDKLERDQQRLGQLVANIDKVLAQRKAEAERRAQEARKKQPASGKVSVGGKKPTGAFAKQRGKLLMPALGKITGRYGQARANASGKSTTWRGLMIQARQGSDVLACANGQVVFSDWLRGFGNLIIVDHGDGYLSIYANNESLYKSVGDKVSRGETIASVGNTGGEERPGLYFELRRNGQPFNPLPWIGKD